jgi:hypothetical protein
MVEWLGEVNGVEAALLGAGTLLAFFGWELFRLARVTAGAAAGGLIGWVISGIFEVPEGLVERGVDPALWTIIMIGLCGAVGFLLLRLIRSLGSFLPGVVLGFFSARGVLHWLGSEEKWWSLAPPEVLLAAVAGGAAVLMSEKIAVIVMTAAIGSCLAGEALPWRWSVPLFFALSAPLQWWVQAGRPWPFRRRRERDEEDH